MAGKKKRILVLMISMILLVVTIAGCKKQDQVIDSSSVSEVSKEIETSSDKNSEAAEPESQTTGCDHNWVDVTTTVHHDEVGHYETVVTKEAWDEVIVIQEGWSEEVDTGEYVYQCLGCGAIFQPGEELELTDHCGEEGASYWSTTLTETVYHDAVTETVHHEAETEQQWVVDQAAYDETVVTGQKCSKCGEEK